MNDSVKKIEEIVNKLSCYNNIMKDIEYVLNNQNESLNMLIHKQEFVSQSIEDINTSNNIFLANLFSVASIDYYGWFEKMNLDSYNTNDLNKNSSLTFNDYELIMRNDYTSEYGSCYKTGRLNKLNYIDIVINILIKKIDNIGNFINKFPIEEKNIIDLDDIKSNFLIYDQSIEDLRIYIEKLFTIYKFKIKLINNILNKYNNYDTELLRKLFSNLNDNLLSINDINLITNILGSDIVTNIIYSIVKVQMVDIDKINNTYKELKLNL